MPASKHILLIAKAYPPNTGGVETYSQEVAKAYAELGYEVTVVTQHVGEAGMSCSGGIEVHNVGRGSQLVVLLKMLMLIAGLLRGRSFQFVHATTWRTALVHCFLFMKAPLYLTVHGREVMQTPAWTSVLMTWAFRRARRCIIISRYSLEVCSQRVPLLHDKAVISWNGLSYLADAKQFQRDYAAVADVHTVQLLTVCRLTQRKNVEGSLQALRLLEDRGINNWQLTVVGSGPREAALLDSVRALDLLDKVHFLGHCDRRELPHLYESADVFLHPQMHSHDPRDFESFCLVIVDAMSFELPVVAGQAGAPQEYLQASERGFLVDGSNVTEIADGLERLITQFDLRQQFGRNARAWALENLSWRDHVKRLLDAENISVPQSSDSAEN